MGDKWDEGMTEVGGGVTAGVAECGEAVTEAVTEAVAEAEAGIVLCNVVGDLVGDIVGDASGPIPFSPAPQVLAGSFGHIGDMGAIGVEGNEV